MHFVTTLISLPDGDCCSLMAFQAAFDAAESGFIELTTSLFTFLSHFFMAVPKVATSELCEAAAMLSVLKSLLTVGLMVVESGAFAVFFISICTSDCSELFTCSHELVGQSLAFVFCSSLCGYFYCCLYFDFQRLFVLYSRIQWIDHIYRRINCPRYHVVDFED